MAEESSPSPTPVAEESTPSPTPISVAAPQLSSTSLVHKLLLKLDDSNFLSWKQHVEGIVRTHRLQSYLLHQPEIPPRYLSDADRTNGVENPAFLVWDQQDSALFTWLLSSLSPTVLPTVVNCQHSWQIWEAVLDFFHAHSLAQSTQLRSELRSITKGSKSTSEYLKRIKSIVNALISIGDPVTYREHLEAIFDGLPEDYSHLMTIVTSREYPCSISQAEAMVIAHEARLDRLRLRQHATSPPSAFLAQSTAPPHAPPPARPQAPSPAPPQAPPPVAASHSSTEVNYASRTGSDDREERVYDDRDDDRSRSGDTRDRGGYNNRGRGGRGGYNNRGRGGDRSSVQCQICHKYGHDASVCYYRGNSSTSGTNSQPNSQPNMHAQSPMAPTFGFGSSFGMMPQFGYSTFRGFPPFGTSSQFGMPFPNSGFGSGFPFASGGMFTSPGYGFGPGPGFGLLPRVSAPQPRAPQAMIAAAPSTLGNWHPDSGATHHVTHDASVFSDGVSVTGNDQVYMGNGQGLPIKSIGSASFSSPLHTHTTLLLKNLLLVPNITKNLVSVSKFAKDNGVYFEFHPFHCAVKSQGTSRTLLRGSLGQDGLYVFDGMHSSTFLKDLPSAPVASAFSVSKTASPAVNASVLPSNNVTSPTAYDLWHSRLGHPHHEALQSVLTICKIPVPHKSKYSVCQSCCVAKSHRLPSSSSSTLYTVPLELVFVDLWGPASVESSAGYSYFLTCVDAFSRFTWIYPLRRKSETSTVFIQFQAMVELRFGLKVKSVQTDGGTEFKPLIPHFQKLGITHRLTCPHTHHQNGSVERKHRHIVETGLALLACANMPQSYWDHAFLTATFLINRLPTPVLDNLSPYHKLFKVPADYKILRVFGSACYPHLRPYNSSKLSFRSQECVFLGYSSSHKGYKCLASDGRIYISKDVQFNEFKFPYSTMFSSDVSSSHTSHVSSIIPVIFSVPPLQQPSPSPPHFQSADMPSPHSVASLQSMPPSSVNGAATASGNPSTSVSALSSPSPPQDAASAISVPTTGSSQPHQVTNLHPMQTRAKSGIVKPRLFPTLLLAQAEPVTTKHALKDPKWMAAMQAEYDALMANNTWTLVSLPKDRHPIGCKWVFRIKENADGTVNRYKARLVAKGYHQVKGFDYAETFSPVVKPITIRLILTLAVSKRWHIHQLDVNNAFLHGALQEEVYMQQPTGFQNSDKSLVCKLNKALYGLKQAPRAWFDRLKGALVKYGFKASCCDPSLFTFHNKSNVIYILVYVDDIIITGNFLPFIQEVVQKLNSEFALKQLGQLDYFLGVQVHHLQDRSLLLTQTKYIGDLLERADMAEAKGISTPMISSARLSKYGADYFPDPTLYRSIVGALQYATLTRPEISFSVNKVCQFLSQPLEEHWKAVKRILRYLKGTIHHGLHIKPCSLHTPVSLVAYCDADWGSDPDDRRSTSGYCVFFGPNLVTWTSKKQTLVARSSTEAEYRSLANTSAELLWIQSLLQELQVPFTVPKIYCDNMGAVALTHNPVLHTRTKHMELDIFFVREKVQNQSLFVHHVPSVDQIADIFTKALSPTRFEDLRSKLNVLENFVPHPP